MDVGLRLICALADEQKEGREEFLSVDGITAKDGFENVALQLVLGGRRQQNMVMGGNVKAAVHLRASDIFTVCVCVCGSGGSCPHLALDVSQVNGLRSDVQEHLLAPQLLVLSQEGEASLRLLHALHVAVLQRKRQQVLRAKKKKEADRQTDRKREGKNVATVAVLGCDVSRVVVVEEGGRETHLNEVS